MSKIFKTGVESPAVKRMSKMFKTGEESHAARQAFAHGYTPQEIYDYYRGKYPLNVLNAEYDNWARLGGSVSAFSHDTEERLVDSIVKERIKTGVLPPRDRWIASTRRRNPKFSNSELRKVFDVTAAAVVREMGVANRKATLLEGVVAGVNSMALLGLKVLEFNPFESLQRKRLKKKGNTEALKVMDDLRPSTAFKRHLDEWTAPMGGLQTVATAQPVGHFIGEQSLLAALTAGTGNIEHAAVNVFGKTAVKLFPRLVNVAAKLGKAEPIVGAALRAGTINVAWDTLLQTPNLDDQGVADWLATAAKRAPATFAVGAALGGAVHGAVSLGAARRLRSYTEKWGEPLVEAGKGTNVRGNVANELALTQQHGSKHNALRNANIEIAAKLKEAGFQEDILKNVQSDVKAQMVEYGIKPNEVIAKTKEGWIVALTEDGNHILLKPRNSPRLDANQLDDIQKQYRPEPPTGFVEKERPGVRQGKSEAPTEAPTAEPTTGGQPAPDEQVVRHSAEPVEPTPEPSRPVEHPITDANGEPIPAPGEVQAEPVKPRGVRQGKSDAPTEAPTAERTRETTADVAAEPIPERVVERPQAETRTDTPETAREPIVDRPTERPTVDVKAEAAAGEPVIERPLTESTTEPSASQQTGKTTRQAEPTPEPAKPLTESMTVDADQPVEAARQGAEPIGRTKFGVEDAAKSTPGSERARAQEAVESGGAAARQATVKQHIEVTEKTLDDVNAFAKENNINPTEVFANEYYRNQFASMNPTFNTATTRMKDGTIDVYFLVEQQVSPNPRALTDVEVLALTAHRSSLSTRMSRLRDRLLKLPTEKIKTEGPTIVKQIDDIQLELALSNQALINSGSVASRALNAFRFSTTEQLTPEFIAAYRSAKGKPLSPRSMKSVEELFDTLNKLDASFKVQLGSGVKGLSSDIRVELLQSSKADVAQLLKQAGEIIENRLRIESASGYSMPSSIAELMGDQDYLASLLYVLHNEVLTNPKATRRSIINALTKRYTGVNRNILEELFDTASLGEYLAVEQVKPKVVKPEGGVETGAVVETAEATPRRPGEKVAEPSETTGETGKETPTPKLPDSEALTEAKAKEMINDVDALRQALKDVSKGREPKAPSGVSRETAKVINDLKSQKSAKTQSERAKVMNDNSEALGSRLDDVYTEIYNVLRNTETPLIFNRRTGRSHRSDSFDGALGIWHFKKQVEETLNSFKNPQTFWRTVGDWLSIPKTLIASGDMSAMGNQLGVPSVKYTKDWVKGFGQHGKIFYDPVHAAKMELIRQADPRFNHALSTGLDLQTSINTAQVIENVEERFRAARLLNKIPVIGEVVNRSEIAFSAVTTEMRWRMYLDMWETYGNSISRQEWVALNKVINAATGRGSLGSLDSAAGTLAHGLFGPRLVASRPQMLYYMSKKGPAGKLAREMMAKFAVSRLLILLMFGMASKIYEGIQVETDLRSTDIGRVVIGNSHYDFSAGLRPFFRYPMQVLSGQQISDRGKITNIDKVRRSVGFVRSKSAPVPGVLFDYVINDQKNFFTGEEQEALTLAKELTVFLPVQDMMDAYEEGGADAAMAAYLMSFFGFQVASYSHDENTSLRKREFTAKQGKVRKKPGVITHLFRQAPTPLRKREFGKD